MVFKMKKLLLFIFIFSSSSWADFFQEVNQTLNKNRFDILKNKISYVDLPEDHQKRMEGAVKDLDTIFKQPPRPEYATQTERCRVLQAMAYHHLLWKTEWLPSFGYGVGMDTGHHKALTIMEQSIRLMAEDPFSLSSPVFYQVLHKKLSAALQDEQLGDYITVGALKTLIPQTFLNDFLIMQINSKHLIKTNIGDPERSIVGFLSLNALLLRQKDHRISLNKEKGFLCDAKEVFPFHKELQEGLTYELKDQGDQVYELKMNGEAYFECPTHLVRFSQLDELKRIFYQGLEIQSQKTMDLFTHGYFSDHGYLEPWSFQLPYHKIIDRVIRHCTSLTQLCGIKVRLIDFDEFIPYAIKGHGGSFEDALSHPVFEKINRCNLGTIQETLQEILRDETLAPVKKHEVKRLLNAAQMMQDYTLDSIKEGDNKKQELDKAEEMMASQRRRQEDEAREIQDKLGVIAQENDPDTASEIKEIFYEAVLELLTNAVDRCENQYAADKKSDPITLLVTQSRGYCQRLTRTWRSLKENPTPMEKEALDEMIQEVTDLFKEVTKNLSDFLNAQETGAFGQTLKEKGIQEFERTWKRHSQRISQILKILNRRTWTGVPLNTEKIFKEKEAFLKAYQRKWGEREAIMNEAEFFKTKDGIVPQTNDFICQMTKEMGIPFAPKEYSADVFDSPLMASIEEKYRNHLKNGHHLNQRAMMGPILTPETTALRSQFMFTLAVLETLKLLETKPGLHDHKEDIQTLLIQFNGYMEDQFEKCATGFKTRLILFQLMAADQLKKIYEEGFSWEA